MSADSGVPGWYGKLPSLGDFASRRLEPEFVEPWDDWLARGLAHWREREPDAWLEAYLACPSWRFVLMPGCLHAGASAWAGVLMPSVDRVGRYFPLTLASPLAALPADVEQVDGLQRWLHRLDDLALDVLHDDWTVDQLEAELPKLGVWSPPGQRPAPMTWPEPAEVVETAVPAGVTTLLAITAGVGLQHALHGHAVWLSDDGSSLPLLRVTRGLPAAESFSNLLVRRPATTGAPASTLEVFDD